MGDALGHEGSGRNSSGNACIFFRGRRVPRARAKTGVSNMRMSLLAAAGLAAVLAFPAASFGQDKAGQKFLKEAIEGNLAEVQMGQLAQKNGNSDGVRSFGQMLQKDHSEANQKATAAANSLGVTPPTAPNSKQKAAYDRMSKLSGAKFDSEFAKHMIDDHKKDIAEYEKAS